MGDHRRVHPGLAVLFNGLWSGGKARKNSACCLDGRRGKPLLKAEHKITIGEESYRLVNPDQLTPTFTRPDRICAWCVGTILGEEVAGG